MQAVPSPSDAWPDWLKKDFAANSEHGWVGQELVSETNRVRVWSLRLKPGERIGFHRHVLDYFWTVLTSGKARSHFGDGQISETSYLAGDTKHMSYGPGEHMIHDLENIGDTELVFTTVEFLDSANAPLPVPDHLRRTA
jgi:beta-alanine degradation protein BauB